MPVKRRRAHRPRGAQLTHLAADGSARMVDVGAKPATKREATARAVVRLPPVCANVLAAGGDTAKGNVVQIARLAGIMAGKRTAELIPLCHPLMLSHIGVVAELHGNCVQLIATARCTGQTGVEMEALTAASVAALTVYDMLKALSHDIVIERIELLEKRGGRSGVIRRSVGSPASERPNVDRRRVQSPQSGRPDVDRR